MWFMRLLEVICDFRKSSFEEIVGVTVWLQWAYKKMEGETMGRVSIDHAFQVFYCRDLKK